MKFELTDQQQNDRAAFQAFVRESIAPYADRWDHDEHIPAALITTIAQAGYLGAIVPYNLGGAGMDMITFGLLNEALGQGCSSVRSLLTVHSMVTHAVLKWGTKLQKAAWIQRLASGVVIGAFGLSEPNVGSDAKSIETTATACDGGYVLNGRKKWITFGQIADVVLIFAQCNGRVSAFLVECETPGFTRRSITGMLGTRASMLAEIHLDNCVVPKENLVGGLGFGLATVATSSLDVGRYSVAWGSVGIAQACLEASLDYTKQRKQFGALLKDHQLIQQMITNMIVNVKAARLLCYQAGYLKDRGNPQTVMETWIAKYYASVAAAQAANDAVQIHGALGCSAEYPVQRYWRDSKIMEIIEGSTQIQQINIATYGYQEHEA